MSRRQPSKPDTRRKAYRYGLAAEKLAAYYLRALGYRIVAERYRNAMGEIDILATRGNMLVAVEVKARKTLAGCEDSITPHKRFKVGRAVQGLLGGQNAIAGLADLHERDIRFDVIWIAPWQWPRHIKDAWRL
jgi:putative endonuclease